MRFCLTFDIKENKLPIEYRKIILSYIKNAISKCNEGKYYENFYRDTMQKDFCFTVILPKAVFSKDSIELTTNTIKILFSCSNKTKNRFILYKAFIAQKNKAYPLTNGNSITLKSIENYTREEIINDRAIFKTSLGSALCVRDHDRESNKDNYYVYNDKEFREKLNIVLRNQLLKEGFTENEIKCVRVNPIQGKKIVIKHYRRYIDTTVGMFEIHANSRILQHFYDVGIGSRKSMGFGMIDLVTQDLV